MFATLIFEELDYYEFDLATYFDFEPGTEGFVANVALERLLAGMPSPVQDIKVLSLEPFATVLAFERIFVFVAQAMFLHRVASSERFATNVALERLLTGVNA